MDLKKGGLPAILVILVIAAPLFAQPLFIDEDFETGLDGWTQTGDPGNDAIIVGDPVQQGQYAVGMFADENVPPYQQNQSFIMQEFTESEGVKLSAWFYMEQYGMGDNPGSWGAGGAADVWLESSSGTARLRINVEEHGYVRFDRSGLGYSHDYDNDITDESLSLHTWYRYQIGYLDSELRIVVWSEDGAEIVNWTGADINFEFSPAALRLGSYCLADDGFSYFDDVQLSELTSFDNWLDPDLLIISVDPINSPLVIGPDDPGFVYELTKVSTYPYPVVRDFWARMVHIESGQSMEVRHRDNVIVQPGPNSLELVQLVPPSAPPGDYRFIMIVGNRSTQLHEYVDSFEFTISESQNRYRVQN